MVSKGRSGHPIGHLRTIDGERRVLDGSRGMEPKGGSEYSTGVVKQFMQEAYVQRKSRSEAKLMKKRTFNGDREGSRREETDNRRELWKKPTRGRICSTAVLRELREKAYANRGCERIERR